MNPKFVLFSLSISLFAASAMAAECKPVLGGSTNEKSEVLSGRETFGAEAAAEMRAMTAAKADVSSTVDLLGRELATIARQPIAAVEYVESGSEIAVSQKIRYCSKSASKNAKCVDVCIRWSSYARDN